MCQKKPYPRCSAHAREQYNTALASGDAARIATARSNFYTSLAGIKELRAANKNELADKYAARRTRLIEQAKLTRISERVPLRLALDLDETSGGFIDSLRDSVAQARGLTPEEAQKLMPTPPYYSLVKSGWFSDVNQFMTEFHAAEKAGVYEKMKPFADMQKTLKTLVANRIVEVHVVTARENEWNNVTRAWLRRTRVPIKSITHTESKEKVEGIDVYIDDSDKQINTLQAHGKTVIAYDNLYNRDVEAQHRVRAWKEVPAILKIISQKTKPQPAV